jgi:hypothetical protein
MGECGKDTWQEQSISWGRSSFTLVCGQQNNGMRLVDGGPLFQDNTPDDIVDFSRSKVGKPCGGH